MPSPLFLEKISPPLKSESRKEVSTLAKGASITLIGKIGGRGFHTLGQILLARMLGPEFFGLYALGWTILNIGALVAPMGLHNGVIHFGSQYWQSGDKSQNKLINLSLIYSLLSGLLLGIGLFLIAPWLAVEIFSKPDLIPVLRGFSFALPFVAGLKVAAAATRISERMEYSVYAEDLSQPASNLILIVIIFFFGIKLLSSVIVGTLSYAISLILAIYFIRRVFSHQSISNRISEISPKELLRYSTATTVGSLFTMLIMWVDRLLVGYYLSASEVGIYQVASQTAMFFGIVLTAFNTIFTPMIARLYHSGEKERLGEMFKISTKWGLYLSLPFFIVIFFASKKVLTTIYGHEYGVGWLALLILSFAQLINAGTGAVGFMLNMTGHPNRWAITTMAMLVFNILFNLFLIPRMGITGSAVATGISVIGLFIIGLLQVRQITGLWPYDLRYLKGIFATLIAVLTVLLIGFVPMPDFLYLIITMITASFAFFGVLMVVGLDKEDKEILSILQKRYLLRK